MGQSCGCVPQDQELVCYNAQTQMSSTVPSMLLPLLFSIHNTFSIRLSPFHMFPSSLIAHPPLISPPGTRLVSSWAESPPPSCMPSMPRPGRLRASSSWQPRPTRRLKITTTQRGKDSWVCVSNGYDAKGMREEWAVLFTFDMAVCEEFTLSRATEQYYLFITKATLFI